MLKKQKLVAVFLVFSLIIGILPVSVLAADTTGSFEATGGMVYYEIDDASQTVTITGCDTGDTENTRHPVYEIFCIILKKFDPVLLEKLLGVADLFEYLKQLWNKTEKTEEKKGEER